MLRACGGQVRATPKGAYGLDFGSILALGSAMGADLGTLAEVLPSIEVTVVRAYQQESDNADSSN